MLSIYFEIFVANLVILWYNNYEVTQMIISTKNAKKLLSLTKQSVKEVAIEAHKYIGSHKRIHGYCKYPVLTQMFPKDQPEFKELYEKIPFLIYDVPIYNLRDFPENRIQYGAIFNGYNSDRINISEFEEFKKLYQYITDTQELRSAFFEDTNNPSEYVIKTMISEILERYLYKTNATEDIPEDIEDKIAPFVIEKLNRYILDYLNIDIYVPICLATFEDDNITLSDTIEIIRISEDIQKARKKACNYESINENYVATCATHMIVIHNYSFDNQEYISINNSTRRYSAYPLDIIDNIMAMIRIVTGYSIGYEQIISSPINWVDSICADLTPLYGAKTHFVNQNELEKRWFHLPIGYINSKQAKDIEKLYKTISTFEKNKNNSNLFFALKRLNRCMLRNEVDDMLIDATIGLESLLSGGTKGGITYTISNRIPIVFKYEKNIMYKLNDCRKIMRKIYKYRSKIVHGEKIKDNEKVYEIDGSSIAIEKIAVDFLRQTLIFVLHNPEFTDTKKFDECIDNAILSSNISEE